MVNLVMKSPKFCHSSDNWSDTILVTSLCHIGTNLSPILHAFVLKF